MSSRHSYSTPWRPLLIAAVVVLLGAVLRFSYYDSPFIHPDEPITVGVVGHMRQSGDWDANWAKADVPAVYRYNQYNFSSHLYATFFFYRLVKLVPGTDAWRSERNGVLVYRFFVALLASVVVAQTIWLGWRAGGWAVGLGAGALTAVAPLLVQDAHYIRPEPFTMVLTLAAVLLAWPRDGGMSLPRVGLAAGCVGLLIACKVSMLLLAWIPLVPLFSGDATRATRWRGIVVAGAGLFAGFAVGAPGALANSTGFIAGIRFLFAQYAGLHPPHGHAHGGPTGDLMVRYFASTLGWPTLAAGLVGAAFMVRRRAFAPLLLLGGPLLLFAGYFATKSVFFERNLSHVVPLGLVLAAVGAGWIASRVARARPLATAAASALLFLLLAVPAATLSARLVWIEYALVGAAERDAVDTRMQARFPDATARRSGIFSADRAAELVAELKSSGKPILLRVTDYFDEWSPLGVVLLTSTFDAELVGEYAGSFTDVPTCTLHTYHSARDRFYLITGLRRAP